MRTQADDLAAGKHVQSTDDLEAVEAELEAGADGEAAGEGRAGEEVRLCGRVRRRRAWRPCSVTWGWTASSPAARP